MYYSVLDFSFILLEDWVVVVLVSGNLDGAALQNSVEVAVVDGSIDKARPGKAGEMLSKQGQSQVHQ